MMTRRLLMVLLLGGLCVALTVSTALAVDRVSASEKGSLLVYPKVEVRWDPLGNVIQDTFIDITNDYPQDVYVQMYFVNGDGAARMNPGNPPPCPGDGDPPVDPAIEAAIVKGLVWLAAQQNADGSWDDNGGNRVAATGLAVLKFEDRAIDLRLDPFDPAYEYHQQVIDGLAYIVAQAQVQDISGEPAADSDGDGIGVYFNENPSDHNVYQAGAAMMALAASQHPELYTTLLQDAVDWMAFAQNNPGCGAHEGGWRYNDNPCDTSDNSTSGYATLGLGYAAASPPYGFNLTIPAFVKTRLNTWINGIQDPVNGDANDGGSHYEPVYGGWVNVLKTGNLLYELGLLGYSAGPGRVQDAVDYIER
ncbi:MAG: hypothetical protein KJ749_05030, partial [Planctomycetes bacterium]|nr:hypothetical protein [Planctomycetota bacterium]